MLIAILCALALALAAPAQASATENFANEPPFGGQLPPPLERPPSLSRPPAGFTLTGRQAIAAANRADGGAGRASREPRMYPIVFERGDNWQVSYFTGPEPTARRSPRRSWAGGPGRCWELGTTPSSTAPLARGYSGAIAQKVNAPYVWLPLCLLFLAPFFDPRRPSGCSISTCSCCWASGSRCSSSTAAEITASVALTYPVLGYVFARMLWSWASGRGIATGR